MPNLSEPANSVWVAKALDPLERSTTSAISPSESVINTVPVITVKGSPIMASLLLHLHHEQFYSHYNLL